MAPTGRKPLSWLLLVHNVPAQPLYLRARIRRLLDQAGAIALKKAVYALPPREECREALQSIASEVNRGGGHAYVCQCTFLDPRTDDLLIEGSKSARDGDYEELTKDLRALNRNSQPEAVARARERFESIRKIDFFEAAGRRRVETLLARLEKGTARPAAPAKPPSRDAELVGRVWTTRRGVQIDRIASAWLIRRFIDAGARFRFVDPAQQGDSDELRFDMVGGDFTHEEDRCTFETLVRRTGVNDPALSAVAEIVHDIDIKDDKFSRPEARGVEQLLHGMLADNPSDGERMEKGFALFEDLYRSFSRQPARAVNPGRKKGESR